MTGNAQSCLEGQGGVECPRLWPGFSIDHPRERGGAYLSILFKDVIYGEQGKDGCLCPRRCQWLPAPLWAGGGESFLGSFGGPPSIASPPGPIPLLGKGSRASHAPEPKKVLGPIGPEPASFSLVPPSAHATPPHFLQKRAKCPRAAALQPMDHTSQPENWNMWSGGRTSGRCCLVTRILRIFSDT